MSDHFDPNRRVSIGRGGCLALLIGLGLWAALVAFVIHYHLLSS